MESLHENSLKTVILSDLKRHLGSLLDATGEWREAYAPLKEYASMVMHTFVRHGVFPEANTKWKEIVDACARGALGYKRFGQFFDMAVDFPRSQAAMRDIRASLELGHFMQTELVKEFTHQIKLRLLQAGTATKDIIKHFLNTASLFSQIDPSGTQKLTVRS